MTARVPTRIVALFMALVLTLAPAVCCCFGLAGEAMAASQSHESHGDMTDCHGSDDAASGGHEQSGQGEGGCHDMGCADCSYVSAFDRATDDPIVGSASLKLEPAAVAYGHDAAVPALSRLVNDRHPHRGPPPFIRTTLVGLSTLLLT